MSSHRKIAKKLLNRFSDLYLYEFTFYFLFFFLFHQIDLFNSDREQYIESSCHRKIDEKSNNNFIHQTNESEKCRFFVHMCSHGVKKRVKLV